MAYGAHTVYRGPGPHHRTRRAHRARRAERRGQIHAAENSRRRGRVPERRAQARATTRRSAISASIAPTRSTRTRPCSKKCMASAPEIREDEARGILGSFLFRKDEIYKKTAVLSGGEKSRLNLIKFLVDPPNLLLMDEPTTHLDILTRRIADPRAGTIRGHAGLHLPRRAFHPPTWRQGPARQRGAGHALRRRLRLFPGEIGPARRRTRRADAPS